MARNNQRGSRNNNPDGKNQHSYFMGDVARERPLATAAAAAAAVGAGVFLWSRRNQISEQLTSLSDQIGEWTTGSQGGEFEMADESSDFAAGSTSTSGRKGGRSNRSTGMGEIGGGNSGLGAHSGGSGMPAGNTGRSKR